MPTLDELAEELCETEASEAEACGHKGFPGWCDSDTARREHFRQRVRDIEVRRKTRHTANPELRNAHEIPRHDERP